MMSKTWHLKHATDGTDVTIELSTNVNTKGVFYKYTAQDWDRPGLTFSSQHFQPLERLQQNGLEMVEKNEENQKILEEILALLQAK